MLQKDHSRSTGAAKTIKGQIYNAAEVGRYRARAQNRACKYSTAGAGGVRSSANVTLSGVPFPAFPPAYSERESAAEMFSLHVCGY